MNDAPTLTEVFGPEREAEALAAIATDIEARTPLQQALARDYLRAMIEQVADKLRSPEARRPDSRWLRQ